MRAIGKVELIKKGLSYTIYKTWSGVKFMQIISWVFSKTKRVVAQERKELGCGVLAMKWYLLLNLE